MKEKFREKNENALYCCSKEYCTECRFPLFPLVMRADNDIGYVKVVHDHTFVVKLYPGDTDVLVFSRSARAVVPKFLELKTSKKKSVNII